jgi:hypothetical protein
MEPNEKVLREVAALTSASWLRAFKADASLRLKVYRQLTASLPEQLEEALLEYEPLLHPAQSFNVKDDKESITIEDERGVMVVCHINAASGSELHLQYFSRGGQSESGTMISLALHCRAQDSYEWVTSKQERIPAEELSHFVLRHLLSQALDVVKRETPS